MRQRLVSINPVLWILHAHPLGRGAFGVVGSEAKEGTLSAAAGTSHVHLRPMHIPGRFLKKCRPYLQLHPRTLRHQDSFSLSASGRVCLLMQKTPCEPLGGLVPGMQLELARHGPEGERSLLSPAPNLGEQPTCDLTWDI